jgi:hypothetical protein
MLTAVGIAVGELIYLFGEVNTISFSWLSIIVMVLQVFAVIALYTTQVHHGNIFTSIGFVLLIIGLVFYLMDSASEMALLTGALTHAQLEQVGAVGSLRVIGAIANWSFNVGAIAFGYGTFRAGVFPRWAGILLLLVGVVIIFRDIPGIEYIFAVLYFVAWGWLGWALWTNPTPAEL